MDLSVIIPARNEEFLKQTIDSVVQNRRAETEVIAILDGYWPDPPIRDASGVHLIHHTDPVGQRAAVNEGARMSRAKHIMKLDAHCSVDEGFDVKLMADCQPDWTVVPRMYNLHAFDWECTSCGHRVYQGPCPEHCDKCSGPYDFKKTMVWEPRLRKVSDFMRFDSDLKFNYWYDYKKRPEAKAEIADQMTAVGACFFMERDRFFALEGLDEGHGSWGQVGVEVACKSWLSGGRQVVNKKTWFAHMFRTNNNGFSFPYDIKHSEQEAAREYSRELWLKNSWPKQKHGLKWLIKKFAPVPGWENGTRVVSEAQGPLLSVIIPARNEKYLQATIDDILKNFETELEIIVGLDDYDPDPPLKEDKRVRIHRSNKRIGMRPMINMLAGMARGRFLMKTDAHCSFDQGYDRKLVDICRTGRTVLGIRYELDVTSWQRKERTNCDFRYLSNPAVDPRGGLRGLAWHEYKKTTKGQKVAESMSLSGSGWMMEKSQFDYWGGLDENHGTFGQEGCEIACKTWLSGGELLIHRRTWYAHHNRGKAPYALSKKQRDKSVAYSNDFWLNNRWPLQKYSFNWLLDKFQPPDWPVLKIETMPAKRQGTILKGIRKLEVEELWKNRLGICEPAKRFRLEILFKTLEAFLTNKDCSENSAYYQYLKSHRSKQISYRLDKKQHGRTIKKMKRTLQLCRDIKKRGLIAPLEFYQKDGNLILFRGYRRLVIAHKLGIRHVAARVHKTEQVAKHLTTGFDTAEKGSINELGAVQFAQLGGYATDKYYVHNYLRHYDTIFSDLRNKKIRLLELGVLHGASLALWHAAFPKAKIYGVDKNLTTWKRYTEGLDRIRVFVGNQENKKFMSKVAENGPYDIIIDDCGHHPDLQWGALMTLWPALSPRGIYVVEDCYHSYKPGWEKRNVPREIARWVDSIYRNFEVAALQFYYNVCIIQKGINHEHKL